MKRKYVVKKSLILLSTVVMAASLFGCGVSEDESLKTEVSTQKKEVQTLIDDSSGYPVEITQSQLDLNVTSKAKSIKGNFVKINGDEMTNQSIFLEGEVSAVDYEGITDIFPSFSLTTKENDGFGMFHVVNILNYQDIKNGDLVRVYGTVDREKSNIGLPKITSFVIEKL